MINASCINRKYNIRVERTIHCNNILEKALEVDVILKKNLDESGGGFLAGLLLEPTVDQYIETYKIGRLTQRSLFQISIAKKNTTKKYLLTVERSKDYSHCLTLGNSFLSRGKKWKQLELLNTESSTG